MGNDFSMFALDDSTQTFAGAVGKGNKKMIQTAGMTQEYLRFLSMRKFFDKKFIEGLSAENPTYQLVDVEIYAVREVEAGQKNIEIFKQDASISDGRSNISNAKVPNDQPCVIGKIFYQYGLINANSDDTVFTNQEMIPYLLDGDFKFSVNSKKVIELGLHSFINPLNNLQHFRTTTIQVVNLDCPKFLNENATLSYEIKLHEKMPNPPANKKHVVKVALKGVGVAPF